MFTNYVSMDILFKRFDFNIPVSVANHLVLSRMAKVGGLGIEGRGFAEHQHHSAHAQ